MRYYVTVAGRVAVVELSESGIAVDDEPVDAELVSLPGTEVRHLLLDAASHVVLAQAGAQRGRWSLTVAGRTFEVEALDERSRTIREMTGTSDVEAVKEIVAPMPGMIVRIEVEAGDTVVAGQGMVVVEAMKMENELKAPADGVVVRVEVTAGQAVEKGATLVVLE